MQGNWRRKEIETFLCYIFGEADIRATEGDKELWRVTQKTAF